MDSFKLIVERERSKSDSRYKEYIKQAGLGSIIGKNILSGGTLGALGGLALGALTPLPIGIGLGSIGGALLGGLNTKPFKELVKRIGTGRMQDFWRMQNAGRDVVESVKAGPTSVARQSAAHNNLKRLGENLNLSEKDIRDAVLSSNQTGLFGGEEVQLDMEKLQDALPRVFQTNSNKMKVIDELGDDYAKNPGKYQNDPDAMRLINYIQNGQDYGATDVPSINQMRAKKRFLPNKNPSNNNNGKNRRTIRYGRTTVNLSDTEHDALEKFLTGATAAGSIAYLTHKLKQLVGLKKSDKWLNTDYDRLIDEFNKGNITLG